MLYEFSISCCDSSTKAFVEKVKLKVLVEQLSSADLASSAGVSTGAFTILIVLDSLPSCPLTALHAGARSYFSQ